MSASTPQYTIIHSRPPVQSHLVGGPYKPLPRSMPGGTSPPISVNSPPGGLAPPLSPENLYTLQQPSPPVVSPPHPIYIDTSSPGAVTSIHLTEIKSEPQPYSPSQNNNSSHLIHLQQQHSSSSNSSQPPNPNSPQYHAQMTPGGEGSVSGGNDRKKKGPAPRTQEELCLVCADKASGYHYNALACEGCKGFFRRSITKRSEYACKYEGKCEIDMYMRRKCQACRLKKCYAVGMRAECVVPESQCQKKRAAKRAAQNSGNATDISTSENGQSNKRLAINAPSPNNRLMPPRALKPEEEELINRIVFYQDEFENPKEDDLSKIYHVQPNDPGGTLDDESDRLFQHMTEITILTVQLIVEFSKHLPGFQTLNRDDQIILLKGCSSEVMMLRGARRYDPQRDSIIYATKYPFNKDNYVKAGLGNDALFRFCRNMCKMKVDNAEYALITAIVIFSERSNIKEAKKVEKIQEIYVEALQSYVMAKRKKDNMLAFAKLLSVLTELRSLGNSNAKTCFELRMINRKLPRFLAEIWDIK